MRRALLAVVLSLSGLAFAQPMPVGKQDLAGTSGGSVPTATAADDGKVISVNSSGAYTLTAVTGTGTVTSVTLTVPSIFAVSGSPITTAGTFGVTLATQASNTVFAGPATGADATPTFRALVAADLGSFTLAPSLRLLTLQDATGDTTPLTVRASAGAGTAPIAQFQNASNGALSNIGHDGKWNGDVVGNVTGNVSGSSGSCTGNAATATSATNATTATSATSATTATTAGAITTVVASKLVGRGSASGDGASQDITLGTGLAMSGTTLSATGGGGGITNSAGANVVTKSDGTNVVASSITDDGTTVKLGNTGNAVTVANGQIVITGQSTSVIPVTIKAANSTSVTTLEVQRNDGLQFLSVGQSAVYAFGDFRSGGSTGPAGSTASFGATAANVPFGVLYRWSGSNAYGVTMASAGVVEWGAGAATPLAYSHRLSAPARAGTDTNIGGASATLFPGPGTGTGAPSTLIIKTPALGSSGTAAQTLTTRAVFGPLGVNLPGLPVYADNTAAAAGGLVAGDVYRTSTGVLMVTY